MDQDRNLSEVAKSHRFGIRTHEIPPNHRQSLSTKVWGLRWEEFAPFPIEGTNIVAVAATYEEVDAFAKEHYGQIYQTGPNSPFLATPHSEARDRYYREVGDFFAFKDTDKIVGVVIGSLLDWSAYYMRNMTVLPEYQGKGMIQSFWARLLSFLGKFEVARVEVDVSPSNLMNVHVLTKMRFNVIGFTTSEMWGATIRFGKHLDPAHYDVFLKQFCVGKPSPPESTKR